VPADRLARATPYAVALAAAVVLLVAASHIEFEPRPGTLGPDVWPKAILALLIATCAWEIVHALFVRRATEVAGVLDEIVQDSVRAERDQGAEVVTDRYPWRVVIGMAATVGYVAAVTRLGFFLSTALYLAVFLWVGGYRRWLAVALVSVGGAGVLMFVFMRLVYVSLPIGVEPFAQVTFLLMRVMGIR